GPKTAKVNRSRAWVGGIVDVGEVGRAGGRGRRREGRGFDERQRGAGPNGPRRERRSCPRRARDRMERRQSSRIRRICFIRASWTSPWSPPPHRRFESPGGTMPEHHERL